MGIRRTGPCLTSQRVQGGAALLDVAKGLPRVVEAGGGRGGVICVVV